MNKFNSRVVIVVGGLLSGVGLAASAFAESVDCVIVTAGALVGKWVTDALGSSAKSLELVDQLQCDNKAFKA